MFYQLNFSSLRITAKNPLILTRVYSTTFSSGEFTGEACVRLPYTVWSKGELGLEIRGLPEGVVLKNPSEMGEATLDAIIDKSASIYFVHFSDVNNNHVDDGNREGDGRIGIVGEGSGVVGSGGVEEGSGVGGSDGVEEGSGVGGSGGVEEGTGVRGSGSIEEGSGVGGSGGVEEGSGGVEEGSGVGGSGGVEEGSDVVGGGGVEEGSGVGGSGDIGEGSGVGRSVGVGEGKKVEKRKRKKRDGMKSKESSKETGSKKKKGYDKCSAFCCQEPGVDETGMVDWILCDICTNWYHWDCIGIEKNPSGAFNCGCNSSYFTPG